MIVTTNDKSQGQEGESLHLRKGNQDEEMRHARKGEKLVGAIKPRATMERPSSQDFWHCSFLIYKNGLKVLLGQIHRFLETSGLLPDMHLKVLLLEESS